MAPRRWGLFVLLVATSVVLVRMFRKHQQSDQIKRPEEISFIKIDKRSGVLSYCCADSASNMIIKKGSGVVELDDIHEVKIKRHKLQKMYFDVLHIEYYERGVLKSSPITANLECVYFFDAILNDWWYKYEKGPFTTLDAQLSFKRSKRSISRQMLSHWKTVALFGLIYCVMESVTSTIPM
jgi:hypothetical protein